MPARSRPNTELAALIRACRERLDPQQVPGLVRGHQLQAVTRVSQERMAELIGVSARWYGRFERGMPAGYSPAFLERAAYALRMTRTERHLMYGALGMPPPPRPPQPQPVGPGLTRIIDTAPWPAYVSDLAWNTLAYNPHYLTWCPHLEYEPNIMRFVLTHPIARTQFVDWDQVWAPTMLAQIRLAHLRYPHDDQLTALKDEVLTHCEHARRWWDQAAAHEHPDGERRSLYVPGHHDPVEIEIIALTPLRTRTWRLVHLVPVHNPQAASSSQG